MEGWDVGGGYDMSTYSTMADATGFSGEITQAGLSGSDVSGTTINDHAQYVREQLAKDGEDAEWEVVVANDTVLLLDYDIKHEPEYGPPAQFQKMREAGLMPPFNDWREYSSRSGNVHIVVQLSEPLGELSRVAWQAILGSDPKREALHMVSLAKHSLNPIVLVMRKDRIK